MRFKPGWGGGGSSSGEGKATARHVDHHRCSSSPYLASGEGQGLCAGCFGVFLKEFDRLEELWFVLDSDGVGEKGGEPLGRVVCNSYSRTYYEVDMSGGHAAVKEASGVLERLRSRLVSENQVRG